MYWDSGGIREEESNAHMCVYVSLSLGRGAGWEGTNIETGENSVWGWRQNMNAVCSTDTRPNQCWKKID